jgi:hypothetical protein
MSDMPVRPPAGRYGPEPDARRRRQGVVAMWTLGVLGTVGALWLGLGMARTPVTWEDIGFRIDGTERVEVTYEVTRLDPSRPATCTLEALNQRYGQVGVIDVDIPPSASRTVRLRDTVRTSEQAVTGIVKRCEIVDG